MKSDFRYFCSPRHVMQEVILFFHAIRWWIVNGSYCEPENSHDNIVHKAFDSAFVAADLPSLDLSGKSVIIFSFFIRKIGKKLPFLQI
jgi:hypothetical protein